MSEDIKSIADEMQSIAFSLYEARTKRLQRSASGAVETEKESDVIDALQHTHDVLVALSATMDRFVGDTIPVTFEDLDVAVEPQESTWTADILQSLLESHDVTVSQVSEDTGISRTTINNIIAGRTQNPHAKTLRSLEEYFGLKEGYLSE